MTSAPSDDLNMVSVPSHIAAHQLARKHRAERHATPATGSATSISVRYRNALSQRSRYALSRCEAAPKKSDSHACCSSTSEMKVRQERLGLRADG